MTAAWDIVKRSFEELTICRPIVVKAVPVSTIPQTAFPSSSAIPSVATGTDSCSRSIRWRRSSADGELEAIFKVVVGAGVVVSTVSVIVSAATGWDLPPHALSNSAALMAATAAEVFCISTSKQKLVGR